MKKKIVVALALVLSFAIQAFAFDLPYEQQAFDELLKQNKPVLIDIFAEWCPTCKAQEPLLIDLLKKPEFKGIVSLRVDFDKQKETVKSFNVTYQSTLIVFKNGKEVGRSTGDTKAESIALLLQKAL